MDNAVHNLDISMYSLEEIFDLFELPYVITPENLKRAKNKVLMLHPDKSKLPADYFLFYKKAFDIVLRFYENQTKQSKVVPTENVDYEPINTTNLNKASVKKVTSVIGEMNPTEFQSKFNKLFEDNMLQKTDTTKNDWFSKEEQIYKVDEQVNTKNMGQIFEQMKNTQSGLVQYRGVENLYINGGAGTNLYEDDENSNEYVTCDPFSKLKFDDLRKVHKDQTMLAVSEKDYHKVKQYTSTDHLMRERGKQMLTPIEKQEAERLLANQEQQFREQMMKKEHSANMKTMEYAEKNKTILSSFLQLTGGNPLVSPKPPSFFF